MLDKIFYKGLQLETGHVGQQLLLTAFLSDYLGARPDTMGLQAHVDPRALCIVIIICDELEERFSETTRDYLSKTEHIYFDMLVNIERICLSALNASKSSIKLQFYIQQLCSFGECNTQEANSAHYVSYEFGYDVYVNTSPVKLPMQSTSVNLNQPATIECDVEELSPFRDSRESPSFSLISTASNNGSKLIKFDKECSNKSMHGAGLEDLNEMRISEYIVEPKDCSIDMHDLVHELGSIKTPWYQLLYDRFELEELPENIFYCNDLNDYNNLPESITLEEGSASSMRGTSLVDLNGPRVPEHFTTMNTKKESQNKILEIENDKNQMRPSLTSNTLTTKQDLLDTNLQIYELDVLELISNPTSIQRNRKFVENSQSLHIQSKASITSNSCLLKHINKIYRPSAFLNFEKESDEIDLQKECFEKQLHNTADNDIIKAILTNYDCNLFFKYSIKFYNVIVLPSPSHAVGLRASKSTHVPLNKLVIDVNDEKVLRPLRHSGKFFNDNLKTLMHFALHEEIVISATESEWRTYSYEYFVRMCDINKQQKSYLPLLIGLQWFLMDFCYDNFGTGQQEFEVSFYTRRVGSEEIEKHYAVGFTRIEECASKTILTHSSSQPNNDFTSFSFEPYYSWELPFPESCLVIWRHMESSVKCIDSDNKATSAEVSAPNRDKSSKSRLEKLYRSAITCSLPYFALPLPMKQIIDDYIFQKYADYDCVDTIFPTLTPQAIYKEDDQLLFRILNSRHLYSKILDGKLKPSGSVKVDTMYGQLVQNYKDRPKAKTKYAFPVRSLKIERERRAMIGEDRFLPEPKKGYSNKSMPIRQMFTVSKKSLVQYASKLDFEALLSNMERYLRWVNNNSKGGKNADSDTAKREGGRECQEEIKSIKKLLTRKVRNNFLRNRANHKPLTRDAEYRMKLKEANKRKNLIAGVAVDFHLGQESLVETSDSNENSVCNRQGDVPAEISTPSSKQNKKQRKKNEKESLVETADSNENTVCNRQGDVPAKISTPSSKQNKQRKENESLVKTADSNENSVCNRQDNVPAEISTPSSKQNKKKRKKKRNEKDDQSNRDYGGPKAQFSHEDSALTLTEESCEKPSAQSLQGGNSRSLTKCLKKVSVNDKASQTDQLEDEAASAIEETLNPRSEIQENQTASSNCLIDCTNDHSSLYPARSKLVQSNEASLPFNSLPAPASTNALRNRIPIRPRFRNNVPDAETIEKVRLMVQKCATIPFSSTSSDASDN